MPDTDLLTMDPQRRQLKNALCCAATAEVMAHLQALLPTAGPSLAPKVMRIAVDLGQISTVKALVAHDPQLGYPALIQAAHTNHIEMLVLAIDLTRHDASSGMAQAIHQAVLASAPDGWRLGLDQLLPELPRAATVDLLALGAVLLRAGVPDHPPCLAALDRLAAYATPDQVNTLLAQAPPEALPAWCVRQRLNELQGHPDAHPTRPRHRP